MTVKIDGYTSEKIRLISRILLSLEVQAELIKKESAFQEEYIQEFNWEVERLIYTANNLKIKEKI